jgi:hypothetical protein
MLNTTEVYARQHRVSAVSAAISMVRRMPSKLHQLVGGDAAAIAVIVDEARTSRDPVILVAAALVAPADREALLSRASATAHTTRDRQLVAIAAAHLREERDLVDALARDHLVDHPDSVLVAWIAGASQRNTTRKGS